MKFIPHDYQQWAIDRIIETPKTGLFLDMGLGKTAATLTALNILKYERFEVFKILVIAPKRVAQHTWTDEIEKWDHLNHLTTSKMIGSPESKRIEGLNKQADIYLMNRENVIWLMEHLGTYSNKKRKWGYKLKDKWPFDVVVLDESQSFKSEKSRRFKLIKKAAPKTTRIIELTGTPSPNGLLDLWAQVYLLDSGKRLGRTKAIYKENFFEVTKQIRNAQGRLVTPDSAYKPISEDAIYEAISDICVSMKAVDHIKMPELVDVYHEVTLSEKARSKYLELEKQAIIELDNGDIDNDIVASSASVLANKLLQMSNGAVYSEKSDVIHIHDHKLDALEDLIEAANGRPVLVFYNYQHDRDRILERFDARLFDDDPEIINKWNNGEIPLLISHPASTGHGLNLQKGSNYLVWFGLNWSLELYKQAIARLYRQGQSEAKVINNHIVAKGTYDQNVISALKHKDVTQEKLMEATKARIEEIKKHLSN